MKRTKNKLFYIAGLFILVFIVIFIGISLYAANALVAPKPSKINASPTLISDDYENITTMGAENTPLKGWLFNGNNGRLIILVTGINNNRLNEGYYAVSLAKELVAQGYSVLMYDSRAFGESGGKYITYGNKEKQDIVEVVRFAESKQFKQQNIGIIADSIGAFGLMMASPQLKDVGALVVDSPGADLNPVLSGVMSREYNIPTFMTPSIFWLTKTLYGVDIDAVKPINIMSQVPNRHFLFLHGALDVTIPVTDSKALLQKANPASRLVIFPTGGHIETYKNDPMKYRETVFSFLKSELGAYDN